MFIEKVKLNHHQLNSYPYHLDLFKKPFELNMDHAVIIILGENGSGKSSLLKLIQAKLSLIEISSPLKQKSQYIDHSPFHIKKGLGRTNGYFFESISFINYTMYIKNEIAYAKEMIDEVDRTYHDKSDYAKMLAKSPHQKTIYELNELYGIDLSSASHGEAYLDFFKSRMRNQQLYLLDEPETPLSTHNQLVLTSMIMDQTKKGCQFIIATHSPILAAIPNALIYEIKDHEFVNVKYEDVESIGLLKHFLNQKEQFLKHLSK